jgi:hypothetical protein
MEPAGVTMSAPGDLPDIIVTKEAPPTESDAAAAAAEALRSQQADLVRTLMMETAELEDRV